MQRKVLSVPRVKAVTGDFTVIPRPFCEVMEVLGPIKDESGRQGSALDIKPSKVVTPLTIVARIWKWMSRRKGRCIMSTLTTTMPAHENVAHMPPNPQARDNGSGDSRAVRVEIAGKGQWEIQPPLGREMVTVISSPDPLFAAAARPETADQTILVSLRKTLRLMRRASAWRRRTASRSAPTAKRASANLIARLIGINGYSRQSKTSIAVVNGNRGGGDFIAVALVAGLAKSALLRRWFTAAGRPKILCRRRGDPGRGDHRRAAVNRQRSFRSASDSGYQAGGGDRSPQEVPGQVHGCAAGASAHLPQHAVKRQSTHTLPWFLMIGAGAAGKTVGRSRPPGFSDLLRRHPRSRRKIAMVGIDSMLMLGHCRPLHDPRRSGA